VLVLFCGLLAPAFAQTFVGEWRAAEGSLGPTGLALSTEGGVNYLYVSDHPRGRVLKFNTATGTLVGAFGKTGTANGEFNAPYGIARDPVSGDFYVAERGNHRISRITSSGAFVMAWGTIGTAQGQFNEPIGVAVDAAGDVYVTDHSNHRVQKFRVTQTGGVWSAANVAMWGTQGTSNGQFNQPYGITADAAGNLWVADGLNGRVQKFNTSGVYLATLGGPGTAPGQFVIPTWVGIDPNGDLLVTSTNSNPQLGTLPDSNSQWVSRFTSAGVFVSRWGGSYGEGPGQFRLPFGAVVGPNNRAYVADYYNTRVQIFDLNATGAADTTAPSIASFTTGAVTATSVTFQLNFSEPVTGVDSADFTVVTAGGAVATIGTVTGSAASYSVPVSFTGTGTVQLNLKTSGTGIVDAANNAIVGGATGPIYTMGSDDTSKPGNGRGRSDRLVNLSSRLRVTGSDASRAVVAGFVVTGQAPKQVLIRAVGPGLSGFGVGDSLAQPVLTLRDSAGKMVAENDGWKNLSDISSAGDRVGAFKLGNGSRDAALLVSLAPGAYTAQVTANGNGIVLLEVYDMTSGSQLTTEVIVNISTRGYVGTGDDVLVAGFVVTGNAPKRVLIRGIGPALAAFGVPDTLQDPLLKVYTAGAANPIAQNDNWETPQPLAPQTAATAAEISAASSAAGAFALGAGGKDAAIVVSLPPGNYTAVVSGVNNTTGAGLVEVYELP
jgi:sugar lactone lactonase YvrE